MARRYAPVPEPTISPEALRSSSLALKENVEVLTRQRGDPALSCVTWADLLALGMITADKMPKKNT